MDGHCHCHSAPVTRSAKETAESKEEKKSGPWKEAVLYLSRVVSNEERTPPLKFLPIQVPAIRRPKVPLRLALRIVQAHWSPALTGPGSRQY